MTVNDVVRVTPCDCVVLSCETVNNNNRIFENDELFNNYLNCEVIEISTVREGLIEVVFREA